MPLSIGVVVALPQARKPGHVPSVQAPKLTQLGELQPRRTNPLGMVEKLLEPLKILVRISARSDRHANGLSGPIR